MYSITVIMAKRHVDLIVISDLHLGTYGCHAQEILNYLQSVEPKTLILNGDIIDIWNFKKRYFPKTHMHVIRQILKMAEKNCKVFYLTGNHDEALRKYSGTFIGNIIIEDKLLLKLNGQTTWIFHGDIFDNTTKGWAKTIAKLGGKGYDILIILNRLINQIMEYFGKEKLSFSKKIKSSVKKAVKWINNFEQTAAELAAEQGFHTVICGHIHQPQHTKIETKNGSVNYLNSGDWVEHCSALEYHTDEWRIVYYDNIFPKNPELYHAEPSELADNHQFDFENILPSRLS